MHTDDPRIQDLEKTMRSYKRTVYGIALTQLKSRHEADDLFQEVFLLYYRKELSFDTEEQKRAWLIRAAVNKCRQFNRRRWDIHIDKTRELPEDIAVSLTGEEQELYAAVRELPEKLREAVYLHYFLGLSVNETADTLGLRPGTVSMRLNRAKKLLKKRLEGAI